MNEKTEPMSSFIFQNRTVTHENVEVEFPEWFERADAHAFWMVVNQAREGNAGSAALAFMDLLDRYYLKGGEQVLVDGLKIAFEDATGVHYETGKEEVQ